MRRAAALAVEYALLPYDERVIPEQTPAVQEAAVTTYWAPDAVARTSPTAMGTEVVIEYASATGPVDAPHSGGGTAKLKLEPTTRPAGTGVPQEREPTPSVGAVATVAVVMAMEEDCTGVYSMVAPKRTPDAVGEEMTDPASTAAALATGTPTAPLKKQHLTTPLAIAEQLAGQPVGIFPPG